MRSELLAIVALGLVACGGKTKEIDDPQMEAAGQQAGADSAELGKTPTDSSEGEIQAQVQLIGTSLQSLVSQHQAYAASDSTGALPTRTWAERAEGDPVVEWDGSHMVVQWSVDESGFEWVYDLDLTFAATSDGGQTIDGHYDFRYGISGFEYDIKVDYNTLTIDGAGCLISGNLDITYSYSLTGILGSIPGAGATNSNGRVIATYGGCDVVTIEGS
jgi:hypothetical protein